MKRRNTEDKKGQRTKRFKSEILDSNEKEEKCDQIENYSEKEKEKNTWDRREFKNSEGRERFWKRSYSDGRNIRKERVGYDFDVPYNVKVLTDKNKFAWQELLRAEAIKELQEFYCSSLKEKFNIHENDVPYDAFNRWLTEQYSLPGNTNDGNYDAILPGIVELSQSKVLQREIIKLFPAPSYISWSQRNRPSLKTLSIFERYVNKGLEDIKSKEYDEEEKAELKSTCFNELKNMEQIIEGKVTPELISDLLQRINSNCFPFFNMVYSPLVSEWYQEFNNKALTLSMKLCKPSSPPKESPKVELYRDSYTVSYSGDVHKLQIMHYKKLQKLYILHSSTIDPGLDYFEERLYCLLRRYQTCFGNHGSGFQAAAPETVFKYLSSEFEVCHETFASPLNCYYARYNSAFPDTDSYFGSQGSFFDFRPIEGSFQLGTPNVEEVMNKAADHVIELLERAVGPMSFILFVPNWNNPPAKFLIVYGETKFKQEDFLISGNDYCYIRGNQQEPSYSNDYFTAPFSSRVFILQNNEGSKKWPVTEKQIQGLKDAFKESKYLK